MPDNSEPTSMTVAARSENDSTGAVVSIIVTFHNSVGYVDAAIAMIDAQGFTDYELLLVDDSSTDGTTVALQAAAAARPRSTVLALDPNRGVAAARNEAVAHATGEYVWFVDCDDAWEPTILESLVAGARASGSDIVTCRAVRASSMDDRETRPLDGLPERTTLDRTGAIRALIARELRGYLWTKLIRRELLGVEPFPILSSQSDFAGVIGMVDRSSSVTFLPDILYTHLVRPGSITNGSNPNLRNLETCWREARALAVDSGTYGPRDRDLEFFDYADYYGAAIDTFYRSGSDSAESMAQLREIRRAMSIGSILRVARRDPTLGAGTLGFKLVGSGFGRLYSLYRRVSRRAALQ